LGLLIAGCRGATPAGQLSGEPLVVGPVESVAHRATASGILVRAAPGSREMCGISATADVETRYLRRAPDGETEPAALADLAVGDTVEVYVEGPVAESCPVQGRVSTIVIRVAGGR
jgi:endonuclease YncB( thermonuclease family)